MNLLRAITDTAKAALYAAEDTLFAPHAASYALFMPNPAFQIPSAFQAQYTYIWSKLTTVPYPDPVASILYADAPTWVAGGSPQDTRAGTLYYQAGRTDRKSVV